MGMAVPMLDRKGWVNDPALKADAAFSYFIVADYSQSNNHQGAIHSLPFLIQKNGRNFFSLKDDVANALRELLGAYFDNVQAEVTVDVPTKDISTDKARYNIRMSVIVTENGKQYSLGRLIGVTNNHVANILNL